MTTIRCHCGYTLDLPTSAWEAANQTCPGCGTTLEYLLNPQENDARIHKELRTAHTRTFIPMPAFGLFWLALWIGFFVAQPTSRQMLGWESAGVLTYVFIVMLLLFLPMCNWVLGMSISSGCYTWLTKKMYVEDRVAFARAGGFDLALWTPVACLLLLGGYYWATFTERLSGPVWRSPIGFVLLWIAAVVVVEVVLCFVCFKLLRPKFGKRSW